MDAIVAWLNSLGLGKYSELFVENDIDFEVLPDLSESHLAELGISLGHRIKLLKACLLYTSPSPRDKRQSRMPSSA